MAIRTICNINECGKPHYSKGWCRPHYKRWYLHGDPLKGRIPQGDAFSYFVNEVLKYERDDCLIWPYGKDSLGYARIWNGEERKAENVNRMVCDHFYGQSPENHVAAHSCGMGRDGCVNHRHLRWATHKENANDTVLHRKLKIGRFK